jgi:hypothetical protein
MPSLYRLYSVLEMLLFGAGVTLAVVLATGTAEAVLPALDLGAQRLPATAAVLVVAVVLSAVVGRLRLGVWAGIGRQAGLEPAGSLLASSIPFVGDSLAPLEGSVRGRTVRATSYSVQQGGADVSDTQYTLVEAALDDPLGSGVVVGPESAWLVSHMDDRLPNSVERVAVGDGLLMVGDAAGRYVEDLPTDRVRSDLLDADGATVLVVGDPAAPYEDELFTSFWTRPCFDETTVAANADGLTFDPDELASRLRAVAEAADTVERLAERDERARASGQE